MNPHTPGCEDCGDCINFSDVSFSYGSQPVLANLSFHIGCGEYVGIVGPNGGGKSTMLRLLLGLIKPSKGTVTVYGDPPAMARKGGKIGYVPQRVAQQDFAFPATVEEIVRSGVLGESPTGALERALSTAEILPLRHRQIGELSGGERQRAFIARALVGKPHMLILDEPTTGVDPEARARFSSLLRTLNEQEGLTILFVTHDVEAMAKEAGSILSIDQRVLSHVSAKDFIPDQSHRHHHHSTHASSLRS